MFINCMFAYIGHISMQSLEHVIDVVRYSYLPYYLPFWTFYGCVSVVD
jgi:hypothetical protein